MTSRLGRYGFAAFMVLLGTAGLTYFGSLFDIEREPFMLFTPSVFVAAVVGGLGPGLLATFLGSMAVELIVLGTHQQHTSPEVLRLSVFAMVGAGISVLAEGLKRERALAEQRADLANRRADELAVARADAERNAREAERRAAELDVLFDVSPIGIARTDSPTCFPVTVNRSLEQRLGLVDNNASASVPLGAEPPPFKVSDRDGIDLPPDALPLQTAVRTRQPVLDSEFNVVRGDGRLVTLVGHAVPLFDEVHQVRGAIGVFSDVTEDRRRADEQRFLAEASRLVSGSLDYEETLRGVASLAVPGMADWSVLDVATDTGAPRRLASIHRDPATQGSIDAEDPVSSRRDPSPRLTLIQLATRPILVPRVTDGVLRELGASPTQVNDTRRLHVTSALVVPLAIRGTAIAAFAWMRCGDRLPFDERDLALAVEVGQRAAQAVEHARLYREAQSANRLKDEFVATLSHELRTPLNALLGWTELLRSGLLTPERQRDAIEAVHRAATAQAQLTNDLVDVSRAVSGKFRLEPREVDVGPVVRAAADVFRHAAESKGLWLRCDVDTVESRVVADPDRLQQIVYNLVGNAVKFTATGGVDVHAAVSGGWLELTVRDTGRGIATDFLPYVFDRFRQADARVTREFGGLGLGLSIVRALVELHGGTVRADSAGVGHGAAFTVRIPVTAGLSGPGGPGGGALTQDAGPVPASQS